MPTFADALAGGALFIVFGGGPLILLAFFIGGGMLTSGFTTEDHPDLSLDERTYGRAYLKIEKNAAL